MAALFFYLKETSQATFLHPRMPSDEKLHASGKRRLLKLQFLTKSIHQQKLNSRTSPPGQKRVFFKQ